MSWFFFEVFNERRISTIQRRRTRSIQIFTLLCNTSGLRSTHFRNEKVHNNKKKPWRISSNETCKKFILLFYFFQLFFNFFLNSFFLLNSFFIKLFLLIGSWKWCQCKTFVENFDSYGSTFQVFNNHFGKYDSKSN